MSWQGYIDNLMDDGSVQDAAICGFESGAESVWAAYPEGKLKNITPEEIKKFASNRCDFQQCGPTLGGVKCMVVKDELDDESSHYINLKTKPSDGTESCGVSIGKSKKAFVIVVGKGGVGCGTTCTKVFKMSEYLTSLMY